MGWRRRIVLATVGLALSLAATACVTMGPVKPADHLQPVAIGDGEGSRETVIDSAASPEAPVEWDGQGALLIRPEVNGVDLGRFVLDTGATGMLITGTAAQRAGLKAIGTTRLQQGSITTVFESDRFALGPLTLISTRYAGMEVPFSREVFGEPAVGIAGFDLLALTVFELDASGGAVRIYEPAAYVLPPGARWQQLLLYVNLPHVRCTFEGGHEGVFVLDAGYGGAVALFSDVVERYDMLEGRKTRGRHLLNFGSSTRVREGMLGWFEIGGTRLDNLEPCHFAMGPVDIYMGPPEVAGFVGMGVMKEFRVVFDYANRRVAFLPR